MSKWLHVYGATLISLLISLLIWAITHKAPTVVIAHGTQASLVTTSTSSVTSNHLPPYWRERLLALVGAPRTTENLRFLHAWGVAEGGTAQWNPVNTTYALSYGESWAYNGSSVQNYWRPTGGIAATALTLIQSNYNCLLGAFQQGQLTAEQINSKCATQIKAWGTSPTTIAKVLETTP